jgi:hypothetical protein
VVQESPRHPEVNEQRTTATKPHNQILAAPLEGLDALAFEPGDYIVGRKRARQPRIEHADSREPAPDEQRLEASSDRLDLR